MPVGNANRGGLFSSDIQLKRIMQHDFGNLMDQCAVFQYPVAESRHSPLSVKLRCVFAAYIQFSRRRSLKLRVSLVGPQDYSRDHRIICEPEP